MRVIATKNQKGWEIERQCTHCEALLAVNEDDIFINCDYGNAVNGDPRFYVFKCPECGKLTRVPESELPEFVCDKANQKFWNLMNP